MSKVDQYISELMATQWKNPLIKITNTIMDKLSYLPSEGISTILEEMNKEQPNKLVVSGLVTSLPSDRSSEIGVTIRQIEDADIRLNNRLNRRWYINTIAKMNKFIDWAKHDISNSISPANLRYFASQGELWAYAAHLSLNLLNLESSLIRDKSVLLYLIIIMTVNPNSVNRSLAKLYDSLSYGSHILLARTIKGGDYRPFFETSQDIFKSLIDPEFIHLGSADSMFKRYRRYSQLPIKIKQILYQLYQLPLTVIANLPSKKRDKLERVIIQYDGTNHRALATYIGMHILPNIENPIDYFFANFLSYREVANRPKQLRPPDPNIPTTYHPLYLSQFGDLEIFYYMGIFVPYSSRKELLKNVVDKLFNIGFFVPIKRTPTNHQTTLLTPISDNTLMIAYGTIQKYRIYELEELNHAFRFMSLEGTSPQEPQSVSDQSSRSMTETNSRERGQESISTMINDEDLGEDSEEINFSNRDLSSRIDDQSEVTRIVMISYQIPNERLTNGLSSLSSSIISGQIYPLRRIVRIIPVFSPDQPNRDDLPNLIGPVGLGLLIRGLSEFRDGISELTNQLVRPTIDIEGPSDDNPAIIPIFSKPEIPNDEFKEQETENLSSLLSSFFMVAGVPHRENVLIEDIMSKVKIGNEVKERLRIMDDQKMASLRKLKSTDLEKVERWLLILFNTGMYMRRWPGPGHPYPILERDTRHKGSGNENSLPGSNDPIHEQRTIRSILVLKELEETMSTDLNRLLYSLAGFNLIRGRIYQDRVTLGSRINIVTTMGDTTDDACIRLSSTIFIGSGYIYTCKIFHRKIPNFNPKLIDEIS